MLKVNTGDQKVEVNWHRLPIGAGEGPTVFNIPSSSTPPVISNGILLENGTDFLMLEDGTSYLLLEA